MSERYLSFIGATLVFVVTGTAAAQDAEGPERRIDARTAVTRALRSNTALRVADLDVEQARQQVRAEEGRYPYVFQADAGYTRAVTPRLGPNDTVTTSRSQLYTVGSALRRTFPFGTTAEVRVQGERSEDDFGGGGAAVGGPTSPSTSYGVTGRASLTQPLLRGFGRTVGELELRAARANRVVAERSRALAQSEIVRDTLIAYYELWYAGESVDIEAAALTLAERQEEEAKQQVGQGALAPAGVLTFSSRVAQLEEAVVAADIQKRQRALTLAQLMGTTEEASPELLAATDAPRDTPGVTRAQVEAALRAGSVELAALEAQAKLARTRAEAAGDNNRARLDLEGFLETQGVSERIPRAAERAGQMGWVTAHVGLVFELPLDDTRLRAEKASAALSVRIADQNVKLARERIASDAVLSVASERAARRRLALAERTLSVAEKNYEAERARFELGEVIPIQVQTAEEDVRRAKLRVARARVDLAIAQVDLMHLSGRLLGQYKKS